MATLIAFFTHPLRLAHHFLIDLVIPGSNSLVSMALDIDLHLRVRVTLNYQQHNFWTSRRGDALPNAEVLVEQAAKHAC